MAVQDREGLARRRLQRLKRPHLTPDGREERIRGALEALEGAVVQYAPDPEFVRWIAQEGDQEDG